MVNTFYSNDELKALGLNAYGDHVLLSRKVSIYQPEKLTLGNHVRVDDFCILSGDIILGNYVHISAYVALYGGAGIQIGNFSGLSPRCTVFSVSDDFSGEHLIGPMIPEEYTQVTKARVSIGDYVQVGAGSILLPGVVLKEGTAIGAMSLVNKTTESWKIYAGIPIKEIKERKKTLVAKSLRLKA